VERGWEFYIYFGRRQTLLCTLYMYLVYITKTAASCISPHGVTDGAIFIFKKEDQNLGSPARKQKTSSWGLKEKKIISKLKNNKMD
jgi:hypothetical protein